VYLLAGRNLTMRYNTFVDLDTLVFFQPSGSDHRLRNNIVFGLDSRTTGAVWGTPAYVSRRLSTTPVPQYNDAMDLALSDLHVGNDFNDNCLISPSADFQAVERFYKDDQGVIQIDHFDLAQSIGTFGFETRSQLIVESDPSSVFVYPAGRDFGLKPASTVAVSCSAMGAQATPEVALDRAPPVLTDGTPGTGVALPMGTTEATLTVHTDEDAYCRFSRSPGIPFDVMDRGFHSTGRTAHQGWVDALVNGGSYEFYVRCMDLQYNSNAADYVIAFTVAAD
jgi:hypothetical protein